MRKKNNSDLIEPIDEAPKAFKPLAEKINELVKAVNALAALNRLQVKSPLELKVADYNALLSIDIGALSNLLRKQAQNNPTGGGGEGGSSADFESRIAALEALTSGLTRQTVTVCSAGSGVSKTILMT